jgi:hypothetical protein
MVLDVMVGGAYNKHMLIYRQLINHDDKTNDFIIILLFFASALAMV